MNNKLKLLLVISIAIVSFSIIGFIVFFNRQSKSQGLTTVAKTIAPDVIAHNISLTECAPKGLNGWKINAPYVEFFHGDNSYIQASNVVISIITKKDETAKLYADIATINTKTKNMILNENIKSTFNDINIYGQEACYSFETHSLTSDKPVTISHPRLNLTANQMQADFTTNTIEFSGNIKSTFSLCPNPRSP
jgi:LPS export ABC transporter protein LptC